MRHNFRSAVTALWERLGLAPPLWGAEDRIVLSPENAPVLLEDYGDGGRLLAAVRLGRLADEPQRRTQQVRGLLQDNAAFLPICRACVRPREEDGATIVEACGIHLYDDGVDALARLIEEILFAQEQRAGALSAPSESRPFATPSEHERNHVIVRL